MTYLFISVKYYFSSSKDLSYPPLLLLNISTHSYIHTCLTKLHHEYYESSHKLHDQVLNNFLRKSQLFTTSRDTSLNYNKKNWKFWKCWNPRRMPYRLSVLSLCFSIHGHSFKCCLSKIPMLIFIPITSCTKTKVDIKS